MRKLQEFAADFLLVSKRVLGPSEWTLFDLHYVHGAEWTICAPKLGLNKGSFFNACYRLEAKLGMVYVSLTPFPLYPVRDYMATVPRGMRVQPCQVPEPRYPNGVPLRPPLAARAQPDPVPTAPKPVSLAAPAPEAWPASPPFNPLDPAAVLCQAFRVDYLSVKAIATRLTMWRVPAPDGPVWRMGHVHSILMRKLPPAPIVLESRTRPIDYA